MTFPPPRALRFFFVPFPIFLVSKRGKHELFNDANLCKKRRLAGVLGVMEQQGDPISRDNVYMILQECLRKKDQECGRRLFRLMSQTGLESVEVFSNHFIRLFASCGCLLEANEAFYKVLKLSAHTWSAIISAHASNGKEELAIQLYNMQFSKVRSNKYVLLAVLKACIPLSALHEIRRVNQEVIENGFEKDVVLGTCLIDVYAKCGSLDESRKVFETLPERNVVSWGAMIVGYVQSDEGYLAVECFQRMQMEGIEPDSFTFSSILKACGSISAIEQGRVIHEQMLKYASQMNIIINSALVDMYAKCNSLEESYNIFANMPNQNVVSWGALIAGYTQHDEGRLALDCFEKMQNEKISPDNIMFSSVLKSCASIKWLEGGRLYHEQILDYQFDLDVILGSSLLYMYVRCGGLKESTLVFENMPKLDTISWDLMVTAYIQHDEFLLAYDCLDRMQSKAITPSKNLFLSAIKECGSKGAIQQGRLIHDCILEDRLESDNDVASNLIDMYAKCSTMYEACRIFDNLENRDALCWCAMISGYSQNNDAHLALIYFEQMQQEGIRLQKVTLVSILRACGESGAIYHARLLHDHVVELGLQSYVVIGNVLIDMYANCSSLEESCRVFDVLPNRDVVSWNSMIPGCMRHGEYLLTLIYFEKMEQEEITPSQVTFSMILRTCGFAGAIEQGRLVHDQVLECGLYSDVVVGNSLIDMYAKCGILEEACKVFKRLPTLNVVSWNAMMAGYAQHDECRTILYCLEEMQEKGIKPNNVTFLCILVACNRAGLVDNGWWYFQHMRECYGITLTIDHYNCMIDLLGHAGHLKEALDVLQTIEPPNVSGWMSLLQASRMHGNVELGKFCFEELHHCNPHCTPSYILMSNIYAYMPDSICV